jgi:hypothetical protein
VHFSCPVRTYDISAKQVRLHCAIPHERDISNNTKAESNRNALVIYLPNIPKRLKHRVRVRVRLGFRDTLGLGFRVRLLLGLGFRGRVRLGLGLGWFHFDAARLQEPGGWPIAITLGSCLKEYS